MPIGMRECRVSIQIAVTGGARVVDAFVSFREQDTLIATASSELFSACGQFICDERLVKKNDERAAGSFG